VTGDDSVETALREVLDRFCSAFAHRDADAVLSLFASDTDITIVTSEEAVIRGERELVRFLDAYVTGLTTYSWVWSHIDISDKAPIAWLLAEGTELAQTGERRTEHPYRMTMVFERTDGGWLIRQAHGSSPHSP
jgi:uncharacterized protein (TIGR02246 family)